VVFIIAGVVYIGLAMHKFWSLKEFSYKQFMTFVIVWTTDVGAYIFGKKFGKTPFAPHISPKKTWEGFWGGVLVCVLICSGCMYIHLAGLLPSTDVSSSINNFFGGITLFSTLVFSMRFMFYSVFAHLGDLLESWMKRYVGVKDSSQLIPGHGGFLDRFDSFLAVCLAYYVKDILHSCGIFF
jgi:phosphatidate cytidylyltransferase